MQRQPNTTLLGTILYWTQYRYDPDIMLPGSAYQRVLGNVYLRMYQATGQLKVPCISLADNCDLTQDSAVHDALQIQTVLAYPTLSTVQQ